RAQAEQGAARRGHRRRGRGRRDRRSRQVHARHLLRGKAVAGRPRARRGSLVPRAARVTARRVASRTLYARLSFLLAGGETLVARCCAAPSPGAAHSPQRRAWSGPEAPSGWGGAPCPPRTLKPAGGPPAPGAAAWTALTRRGYLPPSLRGNSANHTPA